MSYSHNCLFIGKVLIKKNELDSTNNYAKQLLSNSKPIEGTAILTDFQHDGRGQRDNIWQSNPGQNITISIIVYPNIKAEQYFILNEIISIGIRDAISNFLPNSKVEIKWPNDIIVDQKKIAGILIENNISNSKIVSSVVGIGLNVNQLTFDDNIQATSLHLILQKEIEITGVLDALFSSIEHAYMLGKKNENFVKSTYCQYLYGFRRNINIMHIETDILLNGQIQNIHENGALEFLTSKGKQYLFNFKEIKFMLN